MGSIKKEQQEKEIWELNEEELVNKIFDDNPKLYCKNSKEFDYWKTIIEQRTDIIWNERPKDNLYPCIVWCEVNTAKKDHIKTRETYYFRSRNLTFASSYPNQYISGKINLNTPIIMPPEISSINKTLELNKIEQYKQKLLSDE